MENFGKILRKLRLNNRMTQKELSNKLDLTKSAISAFENNSRNPSIETIIIIAQLFDVSVDYLLGIDRKDFLDLSGLTTSQKKVLKLLIETMRE